MIAYVILRTNGIAIELTGWGFVLVCFILAALTIVLDRD